MRKLAAVLSLFFFTALLPCAAQAPSAPAWRAALAENMPLLGDRNWILVVDSAYPLQVAPGIQTIETGATQLEVVRTVLGSLNRYPHVRPVITMDAELPYVPEQDAPGVGVYRNEIADLLHDYPVQSVPHTQTIANIAQIGSQFHILVLKTTLALPYTSVFIRLDCKYWSADAEQRLRARIGATP